MYAVVDQAINLNAIVEDVIKRPFITVGFLAFVLLVPLAWTSTPESIRKLGFRRWQRLHKLVYLAGALAIVHFFWRVKIDVSQPLTYAWIVIALLLVRVVFWLRGRPRKPA
jgi:sulfoxide reductase heme-binding subunit YedZ